MTEGEETGTADSIPCENVEIIFSTEGQLSTLTILNKLSNTPRTKTKPVLFCLTRIRMRNNQFLSNIPLFNGWILLVRIYTFRPGRG
jgi:hypothetical protein